MIEAYFIAWGAAIALMGAAALRAFVVMRHRFPFLTAFLIANTITSGVLFSLRYQPRRYAFWYIVIGVVISLVEFAGLLESFRRLIEHYPNFRALGFGLFAVMAIVAGFAAFGSHHIARPGWDSGLQEFILTTRTYNLGFAATLFLLVWWLPKYKTIPVRPIAYANAYIWIFRFTLTTIGLWITEASGARLNMLASWLIVASMSIQSVAWMLALSRRLDYEPKPEPVDEAAYGEFLTYTDQMRRATRRLKRCRLF